VRARVVVLAGPSGSGKSQLSARLGLPVLNLDDFYKDGSDPSLPRFAIGHDSVVDWDDPASWHRDHAISAIRRLCHEGSTDVPEYDIAHDGRAGHREMDLGGARYFVAEGIFAQEVVATCRSEGLLATAVCVRNQRLVTFWRRLVRDLRERRKPPWMLVRRGMLLLRREPEVVAHAERMGCVPMSPSEGFRQVMSLPGVVQRP
jgi:uridine kinase